MKFKTVMLELWAGRLKKQFVIFLSTGLRRTYNALSPPLKLPSATKAAIASTSDVRYALAVRATGMSKSAFLFGSSDS